MKISAEVKCGRGTPEVTVTTGGTSHALAIAAKKAGNGLATNGGELLFLAAAACYCNDLYREAGRRGLTVDQVDVLVSGEFDGEGEAASNVTYTVKLKGPGDERALEQLARDTDRVAEIHQSFRIPVPIVLTRVEALS